MTEITLKNLSLTDAIDGRTLLDVRTLSLGGSVLYGLAGANLSGRSALLRSLGGGFLPATVTRSDRPRECTLRTSSGDVPLEPDRHCAYVGPNPFDGLSTLTCTVQGELELHSRMADGPVDRDMTAETLRLAQLLHLDSISTCNPMHVSGGQAAALAVACAMLLGRPVLCVDEVLGHLDVELRPVVWEALRAFTRKDRIVLVGDNQNDLMAEWADAVIVMADGRAIELAKPRDAFNSRVLVEQGILPTPSRIARDLEGMSRPLPVRYAELRSLVQRRFEGEGDREVPGGAQSNWDRTHPQVADCSGRPLPGKGLQASEIEFHYPGSEGEPALNSCNVFLPAGCSVGLCGHNGAGKSTLCKVLNGVLRPSRGRILLNRDSIRPARSPGHYVAYAFQNPDDQLFLATVEDELAFGPRNLGLKHPEVRDAVAYAAELFGLTNDLDTHPLELPFVFRKRVAMAAAVAMRCPWTILDEPTLGQDFRYCDRLLQIKEAIVGEGRSVIVISHDPEFVFECCEWFVFLANGATTWQGSRERLLLSGREHLGAFLNVPSRLALDLQLPSVCATRSALASQLLAG